MNVKQSILLAAIVASSTLAAVAQTAGSTLANLSSLGPVGQLSGSLTAGFVIEGTVPKNVLVRGTGPDLSSFGVTNPAGPVDINVYDANGNLVASNAGFQTDPNYLATEQTAAQLGAFALGDPGDSEILATLAPGAYTVEIAPNAADTAEGVALLEVYDADASMGGSVIANLSTRGQVGANAGSLTAGFIVSGASSKYVLIRGVGPDLALFGVNNAAAAVDINVYDSQGNLVATNSGFQNDPNAAAIEQIWSQVGAFPLSNPGNSELLVNLAPGAYTIEVVPTSADAPDGVGMLEAYDADAAVTTPLPPTN